MAKHRKQAIPAPRKTHVDPLPPNGILELERFSESTLGQWKAISSNLNELHDVLHFGLEPERRRLRPEILEALSKVTPIQIDLNGWVRVVTYKYSTNPLMCAGSLTYIGGRFNPGIELEPNAIAPWPSLYIAEDFATAYREKFQMQQGENVDGLSPEELSLNKGSSHTTLVLNGKLTNVFDMTTVTSLDGTAAVLSKIKMPAEVKQLKRKLGIPERNLTMARTGKHLYEMAVNHNWRVLPVQFGLPSSSQVLAEMILAAGFEAILYPSTKGLGRCISIFTEQMSSESYVELSDEAPLGTVHKRLDQNTAEILSGWDEIYPTGRGRRSY